MTPFPQLVNYIGFTLNFFAVMSVASLVLFRRQPGWQKTAGGELLLSVVPGVVSADRDVDDD